MRPNINRIVTRPGLLSLLFGFGLSLSAAAVVWAATANTTVSSVLGSVISISSDGTVNDNITPTGGGVQSIQNDTVTVSTNDSSGYTLELAESTTATALTAGSNTIPATSGTWSVPATMAVNTWGYRVDGAGNFSGGTTTAQSSTAISGSINFAAVPATASPQVIKDTSGTASNDTTSVWYGVAANTSQPSGNYTNGVTYTALAN